MDKKLILRKILTLAILAVIAKLIVLLFKSTSKPEKKPDTPISAGGSSVGGSNYVVQPVNSKVLEITELGQTEFIAVGFPVAVSPANFSLLLNGVEMVNAAIVQEGDESEFTITDLGFGAYKVNVTTENVVLSPDLHTLILNLI